MLPLPERTEPTFDQPPVRPMNLVYAHAMFGGVLGILFAIAITSPVSPKRDSAQERGTAQQTTRQAAVQPSPEVRDLGAFSAAGGLKGHLTTTWSEKGSYQLQITPDDPTLNEAFAYTVRQPQQPMSIEVDLKNIAGQTLCNQQVMVKSGSANAAMSGAGTASQQPSAGVFQNDLGKDGQIQSISSHGALPCNKQQFDSFAMWSFAAQFPDLREQATLLQAKANPELVAKSSIPVIHVASKEPVSRKVAVVASVKIPARTAPVLHKVPAMAIAEAPVPAPAQAAAATPAAQQTATVQTPAMFTYLIEGDDEIVDVNAAQRSIETTAGKTFLVRETLASNDGDGVLDQLANIHYRCDQTSSCTLSLADATVLHATLRTHHAVTATTELSMNSTATSDLEGSSTLTVSADQGMER
jgi:hypothetical protein